MGPPIAVECCSCIDATENCSVGNVMKLHSCTLLQFETNRTRFLKDKNIKAT